MKILVFSDTYLPLIGGAELYVDNLVKHLQKRSHDTIVFTNYRGEKENGVIRLDWPARNIRDFIRFNQAVIRQIRKCDLVYVHYAYRLSAIATFWAWLFRKPVINFSHGLGTIIDADAPARMKLFRYISLRLARGVIATSQEIADIAGIFNKNVIVATGVNINDILSNTDQSEIDKLKQQYSGKKIIVTVRRLVPKNGIQFLIETLPYLIAKEPNTKYLAIGGGRMQGELEKRVKELGLEKNVEFLDQMPNQEVYKYMASANVVIFPSSAEAKSLACIEAMATGTPVAATKIGGLIELIGEHNERGNLIDLFGTTESIYSPPVIESITAEKYQEFAEIILHIFLKGEDTEEKTERARVYAIDNYDWKVVIEDIAKFTAKITGKII